MESAFLQAPFVATDTRKLRNASNKAEILGQKVLSDCLGQGTMGELYLNQQCPSVGLICGTSVTNMDIIMQRLVSSHLQDPDAQVLILHVDNDSVREAPCSLLHEAWPISRIYVSHRNTKPMRSVYAPMNKSVRPLSFEEEEISLKHVLAFFTPPESMQGGSKILNSAQYIVSQLGEPFDLQRFIQLVDEEKWDEEGATFMALRQTLLTSLLSPPPDAGRSPLWMEKISIIDLTDPILSSTGLDVVLMDMALREFLVPVEGTKKLIVLNMAQCYLNGFSLLARSVLSIAHKAASNSLANIIISINDPNVLSPTLLPALDYVICGDIHMPLWRRFLYNHFREGQLDAHISANPFGNLAIWSPKSLCVTYSTSSSSTHTHWHERVSFIGLDELQYSMPAKFEAGTFLSTHDTLTIKPARYLATDEAYIRKSPHDADYQRAPQTVPSTAQPEEPANSFTRDTDWLSPIQEKEPKEVPLHIPDTVRSSPAVLMSEGNHDTQFEDPQLLPAEEYTRFGATVSIEVNQYPEQFQTLIIAVLTESAGRIDLWVDCEAVRRRLGHATGIPKLGLSAYAQIIKNACEIGYIKMNDGNTGSKMIKLLPLIDSSNVIFTRAGSHVPLIVAVDPVASPKLHEIASSPNTDNDTKISQPLSAEESTMKVQRTVPVAIEDIHELVKSMRRLQNGDTKGRQKGRQKGVTKGR